MKIKTKLYLCCLSILIMLSVMTMQSIAATLINAEVAHNGMMPMTLSFFEDRSGSHSVMQAQSQFHRLKQANQDTSTPTLNFGLNGGTYWIQFTATNQTQLSKWWLDLAPLKANMISPVKSISLLSADPTEGILAAWPAPGNNPRMTAVPVTIKPGETVTRYIMVETWPGVNTSVVPVLKTQEFVNDATVDMSRKISFLWLMIGAAFGASMIQLVLTHQPVQGTLALNALLVGLGVFALQRSDLIPGLTDYHPVFLPLVITSVYGASASMILLATSRHYGVRSTMCLVPFSFNILFYLFALFYLNVFISLNVGVEYLPLALMTLTGLTLIGMTVMLGVSDMNFLWLIPAWVALTALPWLNEYYPFAATIMYLVFLAIMGIASVFWYWKSMDKETESLQGRLRQELKNSKSKYKEENDNWNKKMETQRALLNELRQREQQRSAELEIAKKEADAANKAKSDFLAIISHEIRTPMNGIIGIVQMITQTPLDEKQSEYVDVIKNSGETMVTLLNDILDYSKIEKGVIDLENIPFSLRKLVQSVVMLMSGRAGEKGIAITTHIEGDIPDTFSGDPNRIRQILLNLIGNAIKFTEKGGVTLNIKHKVSDKPETMQLLFEVIDTGIGIPASAQEKLFQAYVQADASISRRYGGTGLGLNICRMLVDAMHGRIGVTSVENEGSNFWFEIPLDIAQITQNDLAKSVAYANQAAKNITILVIDDNSVNLKIVSSLLQTDGHKVVTADSGEKALELIEQQHFNLVFADIMMPGMDGEVFLARLRQNKNPARAKTPVFALTGVADKDSMARLIASGMMGVVTKPVNQSALRDAVSKIDVQEIKNMGVQDIMASFNSLSQDEKEKLRQALLGEVNTDTQPALPDEAVLNLAMLAELKDSLPRETLDEIFIELIEKAKDITAEIEQALANADFKLLGSKAHNIRGMSGNFGLQGLMEHSAAIENAVRDGQDETAAALAQDSRRILDQSLNALEHWLSA